MGRDRFFFLFFYAGASTFSFLSLSLWAAWKTIFCALTFVEVPPQLRKAQQTIPRLVPHFSHRFSLRKGRLSTQQQITGSAKTRSLSRKSPVSFFEFRSRIMFLYFFPFQFEIKQSAILLPWKLFLSNESRSFCARLFLFRFINRNRNTAQKEYALTHIQPITRRICHILSTTGE